MPYPSGTSALRKYNNLPQSRLLVTDLNQVQAATIEGDVYLVRVAFRAVPSTTSTGDAVETADRFIKISTPAASTGKVIGSVDRTIKSDLGGVEYQIFTGQTGESVTATHTPTNMGVSSKTSDMTVQTVTLTTVTGGISNSLDFIPGIGQSTPGLTSQGASSQADSFQLFGPDLTLYIRIRNKAGATNNLIMFDLLWIEAPPTIITT